MTDVLLIEDDDSVATTVREILEEHGYTTAHAPTADAGLRMARASPPRLILLDWMLPGRQSGTEIARSLHSHPATSAVPIVLLTAIDQPYARGASADVDAVITKPFHTDWLILTIEKHIQEGTHGS